MSFPKIRITNAGKQMIAIALDENVSIKFTKFMVGSGTADYDAKKWDALTELVEQQLAVSFTQYTRNEDMVVLQGQFSNANVDNEFYWRELGIYATLVDPENPESVDEQLMFYGNATYEKDEKIVDFSEYVPNSDAEVAVTHKWTTELVISSAADISAVVKTITYATTDDLDRHALCQATDSDMGHVKLYDGVDKTYGKEDGIAATPKAVKIAYDKAVSAMAKAAESSIIFGSYVGSGSGSVSLPFNKLPKLIIIRANENGISSRYAYGFVFIDEEIGYSVYNPANNGGIYSNLNVRIIPKSTINPANRVNFRNFLYPERGLNSPDKTYSYIAIMQGG